MTKNKINSFVTASKYLKNNKTTFADDQIRILFLNKNNILIKDEVVVEGTADHPRSYPTELIKKILFHKAHGIIIVHNRTAGHGQPLNNELEISATIEEACRAISITVYNHIIIAAGKLFSFKIS